MAYLIVTLLTKIGNTVINNRVQTVREIRDDPSLNESNRIENEERLVPLIRAHLAVRLMANGFTAKEIAEGLRVTRPAITQYLKGKRGKDAAIKHIEEIVSPLADKLAKKMRSGLGGLEIMDLLDTARQLMVINRAGSMSGVVSIPYREPARDIGSLNLLKERLQLELSAAEKYLELANKTPDEHTQLLLRLIASDSIKHADIVSQLISWLEVGGHAIQFQALKPEMLKEMISLEDSAKEVKLRTSVKASHPMAKLLLEWIDTDEEKHEKIVTNILRLSGPKK